MEQGTGGHTHSSDESGSLALLLPLLLFKKGLKFHLQICKRNLPGVKS
jgi:hypothetical protein